MKLALAQRNPTIGDFPAILRDLHACATEAARAGADLLIAPELALCGYPPRDLLERPAFLADLERALAEVAAWSGALGLAIVVGTARRNPAPTGRPLQNVAAVCEAGRVTDMVVKTLLPAYDVFDESRYFAPGPGGRVVTIAGRRVGLSICEDIWNDAEFGPGPPYAIDPIREQLAAGAELLVNVSASPWSLGKARQRFRMLQGIASKHARPTVLVNQVGGQDELLFDGRSLVFAADGTCLARGLGFAPALVMQAVTLPGDADALAGVARRAADARALSCGAPAPDATGTPSAEALATREVQALADALVLGVRDYATKCGFSRAVIGVSGGIDSALVAALAADALGPQQVTGLYMPSRYSSAHSREDATALAESLGIRFAQASIEPVFAATLATAAPLFGGAPPDVTEENLQARIRGNLLMAVSNKTGALVLSTGNKSEFAVGYTTIYGDMAGGLAVISDLPKTLVYRLARHLNRHEVRIPARILSKPPSAELRPDQRDEDTLMPYAALDEILRRFVELAESPAAIARATGIDPAEVERIVRLVRRAEYKRRQAPLGLKVTSKAFGTGRRYPIAKRWRSAPGESAPPA